MEYLESTDENAFLDFPGKKDKAKASQFGYTEECPRCKGYGGWNLRVNAYGVPKGLEDSPENRHKYSHFRCTCNNCFGWGYVKKEESDHIHEWGLIENLGNCLNKYGCSICHKTIELDSSG